MIKHAIFISAAVLYSGVVTSESIVVDGIPVEILSVEANGAGCPPGSVTLTVDSNNPHISAYFSAYKASTDSTTVTAATDCNVAVSLATEAGYSVGISSVQWRGFVSSSPGSSINFHREYFFSGSQGNSFDENWNGSGFEHFFIEENLSPAPQSPCDGRSWIATLSTSSSVPSLVTLRQAR